MTDLIHRVNVGDSLTRSAAARPDKIAVVDGGRRLTYAELDTWVNRIAHGLAHAGWQRGDALGLASGNSAEFLAVYYACAKLGLVCVPINLGWRADEVAYVLGHSRARGLAVESQLVAAMGDALRKATGVTEVIVLPGLHAEYRAEPDDRLWVTLADREAEDTFTPTAEVADRDPLTYLYTSGTTSFPKGVVASHLAIYLESMSTALDSGWSAADAFAAMMPMFHTAQLNAFCTPAVLVGATIHVMRGFDPVALLDLVEREGITQVFGLPMMYRAMLEHPSFAERDLGSLKRAVYAMAPMPDALIRACLEGFGCDFALLFGQTEMSPCTTLFRPEHQLTHIGAVGTPLTGVQVAIMGPDGELVGEYRKVHLKGEERMAFRPGFRYITYECTFGQVGLLAGYDVAFPEAARSLALEGAELLVVSANWEKPHRDEWRTYVLARALENAVFVAAANRVGDDVTYSFFGDSMIVGPRGQVYATMSGEVDPKTNEPAEGWCVARIDLAEVRQRREEFQTLQNRAPDTYKAIVRKY